MRSSFLNSSFLPVSGAGGDDEMENLHYSKLSLQEEDSPRLPPHSSKPALSSKSEKRPLQEQEEEKKEHREEKEDSNMTFPSPPRSLATTSVLGRWCPPLRSAGNLLRRLNPRIMQVSPSGSSLIGSWYLSPEQHVLEFPLINLSFAGLFAYFAFRLEQHGPASIPAAPEGTVFMYILAAMLGFSFLNAIYYKWCTKSLVFLLQPCHVVTLVELLVLLWPRSLAFNMTELFNLMLYWIWNPLIAITQPDLRDYQRYWDIFIFFFQHALVIFLPFYLIFTRQYDFFGWTWNSLMVAFSLQVFYHFLVLEVVNLMMGTNLNYMMSPPPGPLARLSSWYRLIMLCLSFGMTVGQRILLVDGLQSLLGDKLYDLFSYLP